MVRHKAKILELSMMDTLMWSTWRAPEWQPFREAWVARGFASPPHGQPEEESTQREVLWRIARIRPNDLGKWVTEAAGNTRYEVIDHVLEQWRKVVKEATDGELETKAVSYERAMAGGSGTRLPDDLEDQRVARVIQGLVAGADWGGMHRRAARPIRLGALLRPPDDRPRPRGLRNDGEAGPE